MILLHYEPFKTEQALIAKGTTEAQSKAIPCARSLEFRMRDLEIEG